MADVLSGDTLQVSGPPLIPRGRWSAFLYGEEVSPLPERVEGIRVECFCGDDIPHSGYKFCMGCCRMKLTPDEEAERLALRVMHRFTGISDEDYKRMCQLEGKAEDMYVIHRQIGEGKIAVDVSPDFSVFGVPEEWKAIVDEKGYHDGQDGQGNEIVIVKEGIWETKA